MGKVGYLSFKTKSSLLSIPYALYILSIILFTVNSKFYKSANKTKSYFLFSLPTSLALELASYKVRRRIIHWDSLFYFCLPTLISSTAMTRCFFRQLCALRAQTTVSLNCSSGHGAQRTLHPQNMEESPLPSLP